MSNIIGGFVFLGFGLIGTYFGYKYINRWYALSNIEPVSIRDAVVSDDVVSISGSVKPVNDELLVAPITDTECVAYEYTVLQQDTDDGNSVLDHEKESQPFIIDDGTATAYISNDGIDMTTPRITDVDGSELPDDVRTAPSLNGGRLYEEGTIEPGEEAFVIGSTSSTNRSDVDTEVMGSDGEFLVSNVSREKTARKALFYSISLPFGIVFTIIGMFLLTSMIL